MRKKKEYGGYLPLELHKGAPYYAGDDVVALNSGRYAILYAVEDAGYHTLWLPFFLCPTVEETMRSAGIQVKFYHIDENFRPAAVELAAGEGILWVNYYGIMQEALLDEMVERYGEHLILDLTQSFFTKPRQEVYQVYSCRKFFGVSDGAYVIKKGIRQRALARDESSMWAGHLLQSVEYGTNKPYRLNKENENHLDETGLKGMSLLTEQILDGIDYDRVREVRKQNFLTLKKYLDKENALAVPDTCIPMSYPFMAAQSRLWEQLVERKIYVAQLWKETEQLADVTDWELALATKVCILPIDQRYDQQDMQYLAEVVLELNNQ